MPSTVQRQIPAPLGAGVAIVLLLSLIYAVIIGHVVLWFVGTGVLGLITFVFYFVYQIANSDE